MASLDPYLDFAVSKGATQLVLRPSSKPVLVTSSGNLPFGQPIHASQIKVAVLEILNDEQKKVLSSKGSIQTEYKSDKASFKMAIRVVDDGVEAIFLVGAVSGAANAAQQQATNKLQPAKNHKKQEIDKYLIKMIEIRCSDLHFSSGRVPKFRVDGDLTNNENFSTVLELKKLKDMLFAITPDEQKDDFEKDGACDFAYEIEGIGRYRFNIYKEKGGISSAIRHIPSEILSAEKLNLPNVVNKLAALPKGLVLVTGPIGSGKSTTLAAIIDLVNRTRQDHIITIESPIEFQHQDKKCLVHQREVGTHTNGFKDALRDILREDPDVVLIGEMRDLETISTAIETASTGHLVFGTLHTTTATSTVNRIIEIFPPDQQKQVRYGLAESLKAVISQVLLKKKNGGRVAAQEILLINSSISNMIRENKTHQMLNSMQTGKGQGMQLLNDELIRLVKDDLVEPIEAYKKAVDKDEMVRLFGANSIQFTPPNDLD